MRAYLIVTGSCFALLAAVHIMRLIVEGLGPLKSPIFVLTTVLALAIAAWAATLLRSARASAA